MNDLDMQRYKHGYMIHIMELQRLGYPILKHDTEEMYISDRKMMPIITYAKPVTDCTAFQNLIGMELWRQRRNPADPEGFDILIIPYKGYYDDSVAIAEKMGAEVIDIYTATFDKEKGLHGPEGNGDMEFAPKPNSTIRKYIDNMDYGPCARYDSHAIIDFRGEFEYLSNFYPCEIEFNGITYKSAEAAFQAQKCVNESDREKFKDLAPGKAKSLGEGIELRKDWEKVKVDIMREVVRAKFSQNEDIKELLLSTGDRGIIEVNLWKDKFWGVSRGTGKNWLGRILMEIRDEFRKTDNS